MGCRKRKGLPAEMTLLSQDLGSLDRARCSLYADKTEIYGVPEPNRTLYDLFQEGLKASYDDRFLGSRPDPDKGYEWQTYSQVETRVKMVGSSLYNRGFKVKDLVGVSSQNTAEWTILGLACDSQAITLVPLYDTLGEEGVKFILNQTELTILVVHPKTVAAYLKYLPEVPYLKTLVKLGSVSDEEKAQAKEYDVEILSWADFEAEAEGKMVEPHPPKPDDICTICYTSGTTGFPKGAMLSHANLALSVNAVLIQLSEQKIRKDDVHISYLPASHIFERLVQTAIYKVGGCMGYWQGDVKLLSSDLQALSPSIFPAVPRILNRLYDKVQAGVGSSGLKHAVFNIALNSKLKGVENGTVTRSSIWDYILFGKIQKLVGGNVRLIATGAAPLKPDILQFFRAALGAVVFEGYGQTECCGACSLTLSEDHSLGHVGGVLPSNQIKLESVPEMGYLAEENKGEICLKGPNVFQGYYKNEEKTKETVDKDGWLHTGDIGQWTENYALKIIDRKKNIFKLSQGEYIAPEKIELIYDRCPLVGQVLVYGNSLKSNLVAIIIPDELTAIAWAKSNGLEDKTFIEVCQSKALNEEILKQLTSIGRDGGLRTFELAKKIHLSSELFSVENDLTTPTFKLKRHNIAKFYQLQIDEMYEGLD